MRIGEPVWNCAVRFALVALLTLWMIAACAHRPKADPTKAEVYFQNWQETEVELDECVKRADAVNHP
jgi:hypothetical protein